MTPEHQLLLLIGNEPKSSLKKAALIKYKGSKKLKNIFLYSLDPFKKYFIKIIPQEVKGIGTNLIGDDTWELLDRLVDRTFLGKEAKNRLFYHMRLLTSSECLLLKKIVRHKLGIGVSVKTVNNVWANLIKENPVQKAEDWEPSKVVYPCYGSIKLDGIRATYRDGLFTARSGHIIFGLNHISDYIISKDPYGRYDGELIIPELDFDTTSGIIRSNGDKRCVIYVVFDMPSIKNISLSSRYRLLNNVLTQYKTLDINPPASYLYHRYLHNEDEVMQFYNECLHAGFEGIMVKNTASHYEAVRNYNWMKLKKNFEGEFEIVDYFEGEGKYRGMLGGIVIDVDGIMVKVGGGFSDEARKIMWEDHSFLGKQATITAMEKTKGGSLRHPIYKTTRWDI